jgi:hypothetical protein
MSRYRYKYPDLIAVGIGSRVYVAVDNCVEPAPGDEGYFASHPDWERVTGETGQPAPAAPSKRSRGPSPASGGAGPGPEPDQEVELWRLPR